MIVTPSFIQSAAYCVNLIRTLTLSQSQSPSALLQRGRAKAIVMPGMRCSERALDEQISGWSVR